MLISMLSIHLGIRIAIGWLDSSKMDMEDNKGCLFSS